jgi:chloride channel 3/4/5
MNRPSASRSRSRAALNRSASFTPSLRRRPTSTSLPPDPEDDPEATREATATHAIVEEIAEIKRYEDFTTIDWVQDAAREQLRRKARRKQRDSYSVGLGGGGTIGWRRRLYEAYDAGQAWIVVTLVGAAIGLIAACLNIITEWLADIKLGHCETAFYLNENFCCWGAESGTIASLCFEDHG